VLLACTALIPRAGQLKPYEVSHARYAVALAIAATLGSIPVATQSFAQQQSSPPGLSKTDWTTLTNGRINIVKGALQLTPYDT
jgi:hypothetical protein